MHRLQSLAQLLDGAKNDPELATRFLRTIEKHTDRLTYLIEDLLTISRLESGQIVMNLHQVELREEVSHVIDDLQARAAEGGSLVTAEPKSDSLPYSKVEFLVSATFEIRKLHIVGQDQSVLDFAFESEKLNPPLANSMFQFQPPAGAEVVESGSGQ